jgi:hypothetical protein
MRNLLAFWSFSTQKKYFLQNSSRLILIEPPIYGLVIAVNIHEFAEELIIDIPVGRIWIEGVFVLDQFRNLIKGGISESD